MTLSERLSELVRACFTGIWIESHEHQDALTEIARLCRAENWRLVTWDIDQGLTSAGDGEPTAGQDPLAAIRSLSTLASDDGAALLVLQNFHRFLQSAEIVQALIRQIQAGKQQRTFVVVLSPVVSIPIELEKLLIVIEHERPSREQLWEIAQGIATQPGELPAGAEREQLLDATMGLTRYEAESAYSLSLVRHGRLTPDVLWQQKAQLLKKSGPLSLHRGNDDFASLGGLSALKAFCKRSLLQPRRNDPQRRPRGVLLLGLPGVGKSAFCRALGNEVSRPTLTLDVGSLYGSLVGETERNIRQALQTIDAMQPAVAMVDEVEKSLSGLGGSGDSGVSTRLFGSFLTWLSDHDSDVYVVASCNDISKLPPEFSRAE
ncbi:MAG: AAA family ATPase, partial [Planctomycetaceae bacterium]|nr:AAA family ATPase [Planctomycetaceae bacterium]